METVNVIDVRHGRTARHAAQWLKTAGQKKTSPSIPSSVGKTWKRMNSWLAILLALQYCCWGARSCRLGGPPSAQFSSSGFMIEYSRSMNRLFSSPQMDRTCFYLLADSAHKDVVKITTRRKDDIARVGGSTCTFQVPGVIRVRPPTCFPEFSSRLDSTDRDVNVIGLITIHV